MVTIRQEVLPAETYGTGKEIILGDTPKGYVDTIKGYGSGVYGGVTQSYAQYLETQRNQAIERQQAELEAQRRARELKDINDARIRQQQQANITLARQYQASQTNQQGQILLKPSEENLAQQIANKMNVVVSIPETKKEYLPFSALGSRGNYTEAVPTPSKDVDVYIPPQKIPYNENIFTRTEEKAYSFLTSIGERVSESERIARETIKERTGFDFGFLPTPYGFTTATTRLLSPLGFNASKEEETKIAGTVFASGVVAGGLFYGGALGVGVNLLIGGSATTRALDPRRETTERVLSGIQAGLSLTSIGLESYKFFKTTKPTGVEFYGVKTQAEGGQQVTALKFKTTAGETGEALGVSKIVGSSDDFLFGKTEVIGIKGTKVVDLTKGGELRLSNIERFRVGEEFITKQGVDVSAQVGAGRIVSPQGTITNFASLDISKEIEGLTKSIGKTINPNGKVYSIGEIMDYSRLVGGEGSIFSIAGGGSKTSFAKTFAQVSETSLKSSVRGVITTSTSAESTIGTGAKLITSASSLTSTTVPISEVTLDTIQTPKLESVTGTKEIVSPKITSLQTTRQSGRTRQEIKSIQSIDSLTKQRTDLVTKQKQASNLSQKLRLRLMQKQVSEYSSIVPPLKIKTEGFSILKTPTLKGLYIKPKKEKFIALVRRRGMFSPVGVARTYGQAFNLGLSKVGGSLGASFKIVGKGKRTPRLPTGIYASRKEAGVFIEKPSKRLSTRSEVSEIFGYRKKKKGGFSIF